MIPAPWTATLSQPQYVLIYYFLVVAGFAMLVGFIRTWVTSTEVGSRYRSTVVARLAITGIAAISYVVLLVEFKLGYESTAAGYVPNSEAIMTMAPRYMDWSLTVPLLAAELLTVCTLAGAVARRTIALAMSGSFLMIFAGFLGAFVIDGGENVGQLLLWGAISGVFWLFTNVVLIRAVRVSIPRLTPEAASLLRQATVLLLAGWAIYPLIYLIHVFGSGGAWTTTIQIALCIADITVKLGFGTLVHRVAKFRTAEDVRAGEDVHPESIWLSSVKLSDAGSPGEVHLAQEGTVHKRRPRPPLTAALPDESAPEDLSLDFDH